jgi:dethiobiotin synthetase
MLLNGVNIINGVNTDVGKTFITCKMISQNKTKGKKINAIKPIISGFNPQSPETSDAGRILEALGEEINLKNITRYFLKIPASPNIAAEIEGIFMEYEEIFNFCTENIEKSLNEKGQILIEMSGGLCSPLTQEKTMLDLTADLTNKYKNICKNFLVTSNYLGSISHTISACKIFEFDEIIFNPFPISEHDDLILKTLQNFLTLNKCFSGKIVQNL